VSFLLDTDICSAYLKGNNAVANRFVQYGGRLHISTLTLGELYSWALRAASPPRRLTEVVGLMSLANVLDVDVHVARRFGEIDADLLDRGLPAPDLDLFNGAIALLHGLTMVTHNTSDYQNIPGLNIVDWLAP
jgi:tRNA(fMet)-specific endonuclease VapC